MNSAWGLFPSQGFCASTGAIATSACISFTLLGDQSGTVQTISIGNGDGQTSGAPAEVVLHTRNTAALHCCELSLPGLDA